jgi:hypothetical protein
MLAPLYGYAILWASFAIRLEDTMPKFANPFLRIDVHNNRLEVRDGLWPIQKHRVIPYKNIASVGIGQWTKRLEITTNDGKTLRYAFFSEGKTRRCHNAIIERL